MMTIMIVIAAMRMRDANISMQCSNPIWHNMMTSSLIIGHAALKMKIGA